MSKPQDRTIYQGDDGKWRNKRNDSERAGSVHDTQQEAEEAAREMLRREGGGELATKGLDGQIRTKSTLAPGKD